MMIPPGFSITLVKAKAEESEYHFKILDPDIFEGTNIVRS